jgi:pimeloyl-ACP methyl ester carboxylesterase
MSIPAYPDRKVTRAARAGALALLLAVFSPFLITAAFIAYFLARFRGAPRAETASRALERTSGIKTMSEAMELTLAIPFRASLPGPVSAALSMVVDLVPSALSTTRITAGLVYPYPTAFEPIILESQDGTPVCGHLAIQPGDARNPAVIFANDSPASKNAGWLLSLAARAYFEWGFHVLALDLRNLGDSGRFSEAPTSWGYRESDDIMAAAEYLDSLDVVSTVGVFGAGMAASSALIAAGRSRVDRPLSGGVIALGAYADAAGEVERLSSLSGLSLLSAARRLLSRALMFFKTLAGGPRAFFDAKAYTREVSCQYYEMGEGDLYSKASPKRTMSEIEVPCLLVHGQDDAVSPVTEAHALLDAAGENPMVSAVIVDAGSHSLYGPATRKWLHRTVETFFTYWGEFGQPGDGLLLTGIDSMDIFGNPDN